MWKTLIVSLVFLVSACFPEEDAGNTDWPVCEDGDTAHNGCGVCTCVDRMWMCPQTPCSSLDFKAGYMALGPVDFTLRYESEEASYLSSPARIWYAFQPADESPEDKPLAVLFNGGPGASTSALLFSFNTAKLSLDSQFNGGGVIGDNPATWTRFANLLYIDARGSGFSYGLMQHPEDASARHAEFTVRNFNSFLDGADFVRVILRFLDQHPDLKDNQVFIAGESYGGVRATVILHLLMNYTDYEGDQSVYQDRALAEEIQAHFEALHPEYSGGKVPPEVIARQFSRQILIQPLLSGWHESAVKSEMWEQEDSVIHQIAADAGLTYVPCSEQGEECHPVGNALTFVYEQAGRDYYNYAQPADWTIDTANAIGANLVMVDKLSEATGIDVSTVGPLTAAGRIGAYRLGDPEAMEDGTSTLVDAGDLPEKLGPLPAWDGYHTFTNDYVFLGFRSDEVVRFDIIHGSTRYGGMFLQNAARVETFLTHAAYDLRVYSPAQPQALAMHEDILTTTEHETDPRPGVDRPGWLHLSYQPGEGVDKRTIRFPTYSLSGHVVEINEPLELADDVMEWLTE